MRSVSAADANRHFSAVLKEVRRGVRVTVLSRGKPIAAIVPVEQVLDERKGARAALLERLRTQSASGKRSWSREELYER